MTNEDRQVALAKQVVRVKEEMPAMLELVQLRAKIQFAEYNASIKAGFSPDQALTMLLRSNL